jgi:hypothetical protein
MTADYKIKLSTGEIPLLFNSWMFREYSKVKGIELEDLFAGIQTGQGFKAKDIPDLLLAAHSSWCKYNNKECTQTDADACLWLDEMGGYNTPELLNIYKLFVSKLINIDPVQFEILWNKVTTPEVKEEGEKKKAVTKKSHGARSTNSRLRRA